MLEQLAGFPNDNIVQHIASWHHKERFYILYPKAACNLRTFINENPRPDLSSTNVLWFLNQLRGLSNAVRHIHKLGGLKESEAPQPHNQAPPSPRLLPLSKQVQKKEKEQAGIHQDIKPENILIFERKPGTEPVMKISDFGTGKFKTLRDGTHSGDLPSEQVPYVKSTQAYAAPESGDEPRMVSRPFDMWALGCVWLELMMWLFIPPPVGGEEESFASARMMSSERDSRFKSDAFWCHKGGKPCLNPAVEERLTQLENQHCRDQRAFAHILRLIRKLFSINPLDRPKAKDLYNNIDTIVMQAEVDLDTDPAFYSRGRSSGVTGHLGSAQCPEIAIPSVMQSPDGSRSPSLDNRSEASPQRVHLGENR